MQLFRHHLEIYNPDTRDHQDRRKKISRATFSYLNNEGIEYRKTFTSKPNESEQNFWIIAPKIINT